MALTKKDLGNIESLVKGVVHEAFDELARMVAHGFEQTVTRQEFDDSQRSFRYFQTQVFEKFERIDKRFDGVDSRLDRIEHAVSGHEERIQTVEAALDLRD